MKARKLLFDSLVKKLNRRPKLLIVDDQRLIIRMLNELFRQDCDVYMAVNGEEAIKQANKVDPDLILLDVVMDGIDGHEVCRRIKENQTTQDIPIIFITGQHSSEDEARCFDLGAVDFINKPIHPAIVSARVKSHLILKMQSDALRSLALFDGLTELANRRKFDDELEVDWRQCAREKQPLSLIIGDVDHFKKYNDHYGHLAGDDCLKAVAQALKKTIFRPYDLLARYGGEEFVCLLPNIDSKGAAKVAARMLEQVRGLQLEHEYSDADSVVTVSLGVATVVPTEDKRSSVLFGAADTQLYEAKMAGRAQIKVIDVDKKN